MITHAPSAATAQADPPPVVRTAAMLWLFAVAAGAFEATLMVTGALADGAALGGLLPGIAFRLAVFTAAVLLALRMRAGAGWARWTLAVTLGVFGTLSLVVEPARWLLDGGSVAAALAEAGVVDLVFMASRSLHLLAVLGAVTLMFQPRSNAYFRDRAALGASA
ncbi:hypothetical protein [Nonomuraea indica]|uniref:hypothetical protein n=1 Tax=Nonomuraea indica TaxID=1581193 RepID=UPI000C7CA71B|nr:hypothetical protein [Nonomuraea indica]